MVYFHRVVVVLVALSLVCMVSCDQKKETGKVIVTEQEFSIRHDGEFNWVIDARGKVKNVGQVDVKKVVITGYCRSCGEAIYAGVWYVSDYEKMPEQKEVISYLPVGTEEEFSFREVAFYFNQSGQAPEGLPEKLEIVVESFETVDG